ncbi:hypothetical protein [Anaerotignum neopropionicum]|uniref:hypothetical protein n=1 Tax=Anaerotignum neopropionicum TaxID=36847 RepID=UPI0008253402|nr:hypothetical protein [Anaerotignum neopropionicum]
MNILPNKLYEAEANYLCIGNCGADFEKIGQSVNDLVDAVFVLEAVLQLKLAKFHDCICVVNP